MTDKSYWEANYGIKSRRHTSVAKWGKKQGWEVQINHQAPGVLVSAIKNLEPLPIDLNDKALADFLGYS